MVRVTFDNKAIERFMSEFLCCLQLYPVDIDNDGTLSYASESVKVSNVAPVVSTILGTFTRGFSLVTKTNAAVVCEWQLKAT